MRKTVFEYTETDYNTLRPLSTDGFLSPVEFDTGFINPSLLELSVFDGGDQH